MADDQRRAMIAWTIYQRPADFPNAAFVARRFSLDRGSPEPRPTPDVIVANDLDFLRRCVTKELLDSGLTPIRFVRSEADDPVIVETWM